MKTIKVCANAYTENVAFIGTERVDSFGSDFDAKEWLVKMLATGEYKLSKASRYDADELQAHVAYMSKESKFN